MNEADRLGPAAVNAAFAQRVGAFKPGTLLVLPVRVGDDGRAQYRDDQLTIPKELRAVGVPAEFLHEKDERIGLSEYGAAEAVVYFAVGVAQNMTWDVAKHAAEYLVAKARVLASADDPLVRIGVKRIRFPDGTQVHDLTIEAPASAAVAEIIRALTGQDEPS